MLALRHTPFLEQLAESRYTRTLNPAGTNAALPVARLLAGLRDTNRSEDAIHTHHNGSFGTFEGGAETAAAINRRVLMASGQDAHVMIGDGASDDNVRIAGSYRVRKAARGSYVPTASSCAA